MLIFTLRSLNDLAIYRFKTVYENEIIIENHKCD